MQIIIAAPFLFVAALVFLTCAVVRSLRRFAISIPVAIIAFGGAEFTSFMAFVLVMAHLHHQDSGWIGLIPFICGGLVAGIIAACITHFILTIIPVILLRIGVIFSALCSTATTACAMLIWSSTWRSSAMQKWPTVALILYYTLACIPATIIAGIYSENFRVPHSRASTNQD
jgi:hypothetical protein